MFVRGHAFGDCLDVWCAGSRPTASSGAEATLGFADACVGVQYLPLQVAAVDHVVIGEAQLP